LSRVSTCAGIVVYFATYLEYVAGWATHVPQ
jgi:hypothetical protein